MIERLGLPLEHGETGLRFALERREGRLRLIRCDRIRLAISVDLERGPLARRLLTARRDDPLARAVGLHRRRPRIVDATAGLGRDALTLATLGADVVAVERDPVLGALLEDGLLRAGREDLLALVVDDARDYLAGLADLVEEERPDVVFLDPMFPDLGRAAAVKKEMQVCRELAAGLPDDAEGLFAAAREAARQRVVVKRHPRSQPLAPDPARQVASGRLRFDVYLTA